MLVKFIKPYNHFRAGDTADMMRKKAAELKAEGIITDDPLEIRKRPTTDKIKPIPKQDNTKTEEK